PGPVEVAGLIWRCFNVAHPVNKLSGFGVDIVADRIDQQFRRMMPADTDHTGAGQEWFPARDTALHVDAGIFRWPFVREKLPAQHGMDSLRADDDTAALRWQRLPVDVFKMPNRFRPVMLDPDATPACNYFVRASTLHKGVEQHHLQVTAVDGELGHVVAGKTPGRFAVNELAEAVIETVFTGGYGNLGERVFKSERAQFARRVRQDIYADTDCFELRRSLKNATGDTRAMEHKPQRQSADASANNQNFHGDQPLNCILASLASC